MGHKFEFAIIKVGVMVIPVCTVFDAYQRFFRMQRRSKCMGDSRQNHTSRSPEYHEKYLRLKNATRALYTTRVQDTHDEGAESAS